MEADRPQDTSMDMAWCRFPMRHRPLVRCGYCSSSLPLCAPQPPHRMFYDRIQLSIDGNELASLMSAMDRGARLSAEPGRTREAERRAAPRRRAQAARDERRRAKRNNGACGVSALSRGDRMVIRASAPQHAMDDAAAHAAVAPDAAGSARLVVLLLDPARRNPRCAPTAQRSARRRRTRYEVRAPKVCGAPAALVTANRARRSPGSSASSGARRACVRHSTRLRLLRWATPVCGPTVVWSRPS